MTKNILMACTSYCIMQTTLNDRTVGIFLHSDLFKRYKSVFAVQFLEVACRCMKCLLKPEVDTTYIVCTIVLVISRLRN